MEGLETVSSIPVSVIMVQFPPQQGFLAWLHRGTVLVNRMHRRQESENRILAAHQFEIVDPAHEFPFGNDFIARQAPTSALPGSGCGAGWLRNIGLAPC